MEKCISFFPLMGEICRYTEQVFLFWVADGFFCTMRSSAISSKVQFLHFEGNSSSIFALWTLRFALWKWLPPSILSQSTYLSLNETKRRRGSASPSLEGQVCYAKIAPIKNERTEIPSSHSSYFSCFSLPLEASASATAKGATVAGCCADLVAGEAVQVDVLGRGV